MKSDSSWSKPPGLGRRGHAVIEFAFLMPLLVTFSLGGLATGVTLNRYVTAVQLARNAGNMFSRGVDFNRTENRQVLLLAKNGLEIGLTDGQGVIYLTRVVKAAPGTTNAGQMVIAERYVIGNSSISSSGIGTPDSSIWPDTDKPLPNGDVRDPMNEESALAENLPAVVTDSTPTGQTVFIAEVFYVSDDLSFLGSFGATDFSARVFF